MFEKVKEEHILKGIEDFIDKGIPNGFGPSSTYDLIYQGKTYPPKAIIAYANYHASGRKIEQYFSGGEGTECFKTLEQNGFEIVAKKSNMDNKRLYLLKQSFLDEWPLSRLENLTLEEYTNLEKTSFCYWLEHVTEAVGGIRGGSSYKFGIYRMDSLSKKTSNKLNDGIYAWFSKYGKTAEEAFKSVKNNVIAIAQAANTDNLQALDSIDIGDTVKWKIAFMYSDYKVMNIFNKYALIRASLALRTYADNNTPISILNHNVLSNKPSQQDYYNYSQEIWENYGIRNERAKEFEEWLKSKENANSRKTSSYLRAITILTNFFGVSVYDFENISDLKDLYEDLKENQKDPKGKYYYEEAKSYGEKHFYSAAINSYIEFVSSTGGKSQYNNSDNMKPTKSLNIILYGPPGTGKTYKLKEHYFERFSISETSLSKDQFIMNLVSDLTWWQTFSIALYEIGTASVDQILNNKVVKAKASLSKAKNIRPIAWSRMQAHAVKDCPNVNVSDSSEPPLFYKEKDSLWRVVKDNMEQLYPEGIEIIERINNFKPSQDSLVKNYEFVTFHQSFSYEDFVEGIKPKLEDENTKLEYEISDGIFKKLCNRAEKDSDNNYAIFIDEINRGNVSAIFGELITLIEKDKRIGAKQEIKVKLPYSKKEFGVPPNLYIIGTMNTADRSVEALDTALRRRFVFEEVMPDPSLLSEIEFNGFNLGEVLETINNRIEALLDRDHTIGHSYFINLKSGNVAGLENTFKNNIIPLLQEYFYNDYQKIALVLGKGFVEEVRNEKIEFANLSESVDFHISEVQYRLRASINIESAVMNLLGRLDAEE